MEYLWNIYLGKFDHDLTGSTEALEMMVLKGKSSPFIAEQFRLVNYHNLPRYVFLGRSRRRSFFWEMAGVVDIGRRECTPWWFSCFFLRTL